MPSNDPATQLDLVAHGLGIALVPKAVIRGYGMSRSRSSLASSNWPAGKSAGELAVVFAQDEAQQPLGVVTRTFLEFVRASIKLLDESEVAACDIAMAG